jgi:hypothetical protein
LSNALLTVNGDALLGEELVIHEEVAAVLPVLRAFVPVVNGTQRAVWAARLAFAFAVFGVEAGQAWAEPAVQVGAGFPELAGVAVAAQA